MTHRAEDGTVWVSEEPPGKCELCGKVTETRPYGPGGRQVCHPCGIEDELEMERQAKAQLFEGKPPLPARDKNEQ